jgi:P27 family predicted phage terminase small subunit
MAAQLGPLRILTHLDRAALASYCATYALWAETTQAIQAYGAIVKSPSGYPVQSQYVSIANLQTEIMMRIASEFGFTPASRRRISAPAAAEPSLFD